MTEIQILAVTDKFDGISNKTGKPYTKKTLSVMLNGKPTEVKAFIKSWKHFYLNVGEIYQGTITETDYGLQFDPTEKIITDNEQPPAPETPPTTHTPPKTKTKTEYQQPTNEQTKEKSMREMNILNNAVGIVSALISISSPVSGGDNNNKIQFGNAYYQVDELLKTYIKKFRTYYKGEIK